MSPCLRGGGDKGGGGGTMGMMGDNGDSGDIGGRGEGGEREEQQVCSNTHTYAYTQHTCLYRNLYHYLSSN